MIQSLQVRNLAVIEELALELGAGLNVVTGETGAGKSVLLNAVAILCGRRVSSDIVRTGAPEATVEAILKSPALMQRALALGLADEDQDELLVRRSVSREGRGRVFVNGSLATVAVLNELLGDAVEVVSQGEHQSLLRSDVQAQLLDAYGDLHEPVREVAVLHDRWCEMAERIHARRAHAEELARREDQLRFELEQIEDVDPQSAELEALEAELARLSHVDRLGQELGAVLEALTGTNGARESLSQARQSLHAAARLDPSLGELEASLERAELELAEGAAASESYLATLEADPARLAQVEERLGRLARLQARYGSDIEQILAHAERTRAELEEISGGETRTGELESELASLGAELQQAARRLSRARRAVAKQLEQVLVKELRALDLGRATMQVRFEPLSGKTQDGFAAPCSRQGLERAGFALCANPGEEARPLREAASGGELARLLLALRNVLREVEAEGVLLFDEVDAGVGGRTARRVGERLRSLAARHQVLCITHLPQIAGLAETHYRVEKRVRGGRTSTRVVPLSGEERVDEIARMAAGGRVTDASRAHARDLLTHVSR